MEKKPELDLIETFVDKYKERSKETVRAYRSTLKQYFNAIEKEPRKIYLKQKKNEYEEDVIKYWELLKRQAPTSRNSKLWTIKSFLDHNGIEIKTIFYREILDSIKEKGTITQDNVLSTDDIKKILSHCNEKNKAIILTLASSGMRVGELLKLKEEDMHLDHDPAYIHLSGSITKNGYPRFTFITKEAKESVEAWLRIKKQYLYKIQGKNNFQNKGGKGIRRIKDTNSDLLFPFSYSTLQYKWDALMQQTGLEETDQRTKRLKIHIHSLRSWAISHMGITMPEMKLNFIVGHTTYLSKQYNKFKEADIAEDYTKVMPDLAILEASPDISGIHADMKAKDEKIKQLEQNQRLLEITLQSIQNSLKTTENSLEIEKIKNGTKKK